MVVPLQGFDLEDEVPMLSGLPASLSVRPAASGASKLVLPSWSPTPTAPTLTPTVTPTSVPLSDTQWTKAGDFRGVFERSDTQ